MIRKILAGIVCLLILNVSIASVFAQTDDKKADKVKTKITKLGIGRKARIDVKTQDGIEVVGWVSQRNETDFVVTDDFGDAKTIAYKDVKGFVGRDLSTGAKVLIGVGVGFAAALALFWLGTHAD
jgi:hypothetical protein